LGTVRFLGTFLADPTDVPTAVVDYVAGQVGASDASCLKGYLSRRATRFEHTAEIVAAYGYRGFADAEAELERWVDDRAWTTGEGPAALFDGAVVWLRERRVLLPGVSRLARLVARVRDAATQRLWDVLSAMVTPSQARMLELLLEVPDGAKVSDLERLRRGPTNTVGQGHGGRLGPGGRAGRPGVGVAQPGRRSPPADGGVGPVGYGGQSTRASPASVLPEVGHVVGDGGVPRGEGHR